MILMQTMDLFSKPLGHSVLISTASDSIELQSVENIIYYLGSIYYILYNHDSNSHFVGGYMRVGDT